MTTDEFKVRSEHCQIIGVHVKDFIEKESSIIKNMPVPISTSIVETLGEFNLLSLVTKEGEAKFVSIVDSGNASSGFIVRLEYLELNMLQMLGNNSLTIYREEFRNFKRSSRWRGLCDKYKWLWLLPTYQLLIKTV